MPTYTQIISCNTANSNTGIPQCSFDFGTIEKIMLVPKGYKLTQTEVQTLFDTLNTKAAHTTESLRGYPIGKFINIEDKSTETAMSETGYGSSVLGRKGKFHFVWNYKNGGMNYDVMLSTFENAQESYDVLLFDKTSNAIIGTTPETNSSFYVLQGLSLDLIYCPLPKLAADGVTTHSIGIILSDANELMQSMAYYVLPVSQKVNSIVGLRNLEMSLLQASGAATSTSLKIRVTTDGGAVDLLALYGTALAALYANFTVTANATGTAYAISGGTYTVATNTINFTIATLPATGTELTITSPTVAQMTATVPGFANGTLVFKTVA